MKEKKVLLIINPCAGKRKGEKLKNKIGEWFSQNGFECDIFVTNQRMHASELALSNAKNYDVIACMGGDGTLNEIINGLINSNCNIPLGYIPAGSTNDFARSMNIPTNPEEAVKCIAMGHTRQIDIGKFNDRYFSYIASFGAFSKTSYDTPQEQKNILGHTAYLLEGSKELFNISSYNVSINADDLHFEGDYIFGSISNSKSIAGIVKLNDSFVKFDDGLMELLLIKKPNNTNELFQAVQCLQKQVYDKPCIQVCHARHFEIDCNEKIDWSIDGEYFSGNNHFVIDCLHSKINLIC